MNFITSLMKHRYTGHADFLTKTRKNASKIKFRPKHKVFSHKFQGYLLILFRFMQT